MAKKTHIREPASKNILCGRDSDTAIRFPETARELESMRYGLTYCQKCETAALKQLGAR
jgi:hypothetical protein